MRRTLVAIVTSVLGAFLDRYLRHGNGALLAGPSPYCPEMRFGR
jgi:hypothetical protein